MKHLDRIYFESFPGFSNKGDQQRYRIIEAAIHGLASDGFAGTTFDRLAERLETRRSHIVYYFADREELLQAALRFVIATAQAETIEKLKGTTNAEDKLIAISDAAFDWVNKYPQHAKAWVYFYTNGSIDPQMKKIFSPIREAARNRIATLIEEIFQGHVETELISQIAVAVHGIMTGLVIESMVTTKKQSINFRETSRQMCMQLIRSYLRK